MSRSNPTEGAKNPAKKFIRWVGEINHDPASLANKHHFSYYDKEQKDSPNKGQIEIPLPITFIVLDTLHTIKGYSEKAKAGFYSNEIRTEGFKTDRLRVKLGKDDDVEGLYGDIIEGLKGRGAKYCQSVYVAMKEDGKLVINNLQLWGAAVGPWIQFCEKNDINKIAVTVKTYAEGKQGKTSFNMPVFTALPVSPETDSEAKKLDEELQTYLKGYFARQGSLPPAEAKVEAKAELTLESDIKPAVPVANAPQEDDLPF